MKIQLSGERAHRLHFTLPCRIHHFLTTRVASWLLSIVAAFKLHRLNGGTIDAPKRDFPNYEYPRDFVWTKGELKANGDVYGVKRPDGNYDYELRYNPAPDVILWVEEMDRNYILRLKREGKLLATEPKADEEILQAEQGEWKHPHQFHDEIFAAMAAAREEVKQFGKELSEPVRKASVEAERKAEAERKSQEAAREAERKAREEAERKAREEAERKAKAEAERKAKQEEAERKAKAEAERLQSYRDNGLVKLAKEKNLEGIQYLLSLADDDLKINATDDALRTALHYVAAQGNLTLVKAFVEKGANVLTEDGLDQTARDCAKENKHAEVAAFLKAAEAKQASSREAPDTPATPVRPMPSPQPPSGGAGLADSPVVDYLIPAAKLQYGLPIGEGGFGQVCRGRWGSVEVAIKRLHLKSLTERTEEALTGEAKTMAALRHPNVIRFYGLCMEPGHYSIVMELALKGSLYQLLHSKSEIPWKIRYSIAMDIGAGLQYLHDKAIVHRDLKSLNVLLDGNLRAQLTDFGLAQVKIETKTKTAQPEKSVGTRPWMAPELFGLRPKYSFQSDIYAYGMTLWEIAAREIPYAGVKDEDIVRNVEKGDREEIPKDAPKGFAQLIGLCWAQRTEQRPKAEQVVLELERIAAGQEAAAASPARVGVSTLFRAVQQVGEDVKVIKGVAEGQAAQARAEFDMRAQEFSPV